MKGLGLLLTLVAGLAQAQTTPEALELLRRIQAATQKLSYSGTFLYQHGGRSDVSRITHIVQSGGAVEKLEVLEGEPQEIVRTRDTVTCYLPERQIVKIERRIDRQDFPALLPEHFTGLAQNYVIARGDSGRVAGFDCHSVTLTPRDELRFGYALCADKASGMLLKARTFDARGQTLEQYTFTQLHIGPVARDKVKPSYATQSWRVVDSSAALADLAHSGWKVSTDLPGFRKVIEVRRPLNDSLAVNQVVYSDGLAAVSVFIEPLGARAEPVQAGLSSLGAINIYTRQVANHRITVVGETPAASVQRIAERVEFTSPR